MKFIKLLLIISLFSSFVFAQKSGEILAIANSREYTLQDVSPDLAKAWQTLSKTLSLSLIHI